jgi:succinoglycan biosynthesis protein ExoM
MLSSATVVLPTYLRPLSLARALWGLAGQEDPGVEWDIVVVDNDPRGSGAEAIKGLGGESLECLAPRLHVVVEPTPGSAAARNRGIDGATGAVTVFLDDDVVPTTTWLRELLAPLIAGRCDAAGGRVILDPEIRRPAWFDDGALGGYLAAFDPASEERDLGSGEFVVTSNAAFATEQLRSSGGFRSDLGPRAGNPMVNDDVLLTRNFVAAGGRVRYTPAAVVVHELPAARLRPTYLLRRAYAQGRSDWRLDADVLAPRRLHGARVSLAWGVSELRRRARERGQGRMTLFHALCDVARTAGGLREAAVADTKVHR